MGVSQAQVHVHVHAACQCRQGHLAPLSASRRLPGTLILTPAGTRQGRCANAERSWSLMT